MEELQSVMVYEETTRDIRVQVVPIFLDSESDPDAHRFVWAYQVTIENLGQVAVQLISRHWWITDAKGKIEEVTGAGVVGDQPVIEPGEDYEYTSGAPLTTPSGMMRGSYQMATRNGREVFDVEIPAFSLDSPYDSQSLN